MITSLDHVQLAMPPGGEAVATDFYVRLLGLTAIAKPPDLRARGGCWFASGNVAVHLGVETDFRPARKAHPAFGVDDLPQLTARLRGAEVAIEHGMPIAGRARLYVQDPFGNRIEFIEAAA